MPLSGLPPKIIRNNKYYNEMNAKYRAGCHKIIKYFEGWFFLKVAYSEGKGWDADKGCWDMDKEERLHVTQINSPDFGGNQPSYHTLYCMTCRREFNKFNPPSGQDKDGCPHQILWGNRGESTASCGPSVLSHINLRSLNQESGHAVKDGKCFGVGHGWCRIRLQGTYPETFQGSYKRKSGNDQGTRNLD
jgi:hypothetical protein